MRECLQFIDFRFSNMTSNFCSSHLPPNSSAMSPWTALTWCFLTPSRALAERPAAHEWLLKPAGRGNPLTGRSKNDVTATYILQYGQDTQLRAQLRMFTLKTTIQDQIIIALNQFEIKLLQYVWIIYLCVQRGRFGGISLSPTLYPSPTLRSPLNTFPPPSSLKVCFSVIFIIWDFINRESNDNLILHYSFQCKNMQLSS